MWHVQQPTPHLLSVEDYRKAAKRRLPRPIFDFVDGGAETESAVRGNRQAFESVMLRPRGGVDPSTRDLTTTVLGTELSMPVILAPCGMSGAVHVDGDLAGARAASKAGTIFVQSTMSAQPVEEVVAAGAGMPVWFQVYRVGPKEWCQRALGRARDAGAGAIVITMDTANGSLRERDWRSGAHELLGPSKLAAAPHAIKLGLKPTWLVDHVRVGLRPKLMNVVDDQGRPQNLGQSPPTAGLSWEDLRWVREVWSGPIVFKGLLTPDDARRAVDEGAAAVVVSNHGGRQLDSAEASLRALPEVAAAVGDRCEVLVDGGVRSGIDVLKALSLGARAVLVGRPWLWGLATGGQKGVEGVLGVLHDGLGRNLGLLGAGRVTALNPSYVRTPPGWLEGTWPAWPDRPPSGVPTEEVH